MDVSNFVGLDREWCQRFGRSRKNIRVRGTGHKTVITIFCVLLAQA